MENVLSKIYGNEISCHTDRCYIFLSVQEQKHVGELRDLVSSRMRIKIYFSQNNLIIASCAISELNFSFALAITGG